MIRHLESLKMMLAVASVLLISSCGEDFLSENESNVLFAQPTKTELDQIYSEWESRDLIPTDYVVIRENELLDGAYMLKIVSFTVAGIKEYGALIIPNTTEQVPVRMLVGGFFGAINSTVNSVNLQIDKSGNGSVYILAIPALRGQSLEITIDGIKYTSPLSEGDQCDAFDEATDDVLAFLNLIGQTEEKADVNRTSVRGGSRGGTVALLAGIRDPRVKRVVGVVGPTNMLELTSQNENDPIYQCQFLNGLKSGNSTLTETRNRMIASSPIYFAEYLPLTQLHMGLKDNIVPVQQGYDLEERISQMEMEGKFEFFIYDRTHSDIASDNAELSKRIEQFLSKL